MSCKASKIYHLAPYETSLLTPGSAFITYARACLNFTCDTWIRESQTMPGLGEPEPLSSLRCTLVSSPGPAGPVCWLLAAPCCFSDKFLVTPQAQLIQEAAPDTLSHLRCPGGSPGRRLRAQVSKFESQSFHSHPRARPNFSARVFVPLVGCHGCREMICFVSHCEAHVIKISEYT